MRDTVQWRRLKNQFRIDRENWVFYEAAYADLTVGPVCRHAIYSVAVVLMDPVP